MADVFENTMICSSCNKKTVKGEIVQDGFKIRVWKCPSCNQVWPHPGDFHEYEKFKELKQKNFSVKLRMVGNSYAVSIPREIIEFHSMQRDELVRLAMEDRDKIVLYFSRMTKLIK
ncbi:MAG: AbrB/MazE/SpoVT family DNA-binding domain-containing protein [archaeon]